jgi:hypothetical protein
MLLVTVEQRQLVDEDRSKGEARGVAPSRGGQRPVRLEEGLEVLVEGLYAHVAQPVQDAPRPLLRRSNPGRCRKPFPRSASQKVRNHSVERVRALARRPMATAPQNAQLRVRKSFVRSSCPLYRHHAVAFDMNQEGWRG